MLQASGEAQILPHHVITVAPAQNLDRPGTPIKPLRPEHVDTFFVAGDDIDFGFSVELGDIMDAVFKGPVTAHVMDDRAAGYHHPIPSLFNALYMPKAGMAGNCLAVDEDLDRAPEPVDLGGAVRPRLNATGQDWWWPLGPATGWGESDWDRIDGG